jgi:CRP-like cAMP-binding protein
MTRTVEDTAGPANLTAAKPEETPAPAPAMRTMLQNVTILAGLDEATVKFLSERAVQSKISAGSIVLHEGEVGNRFFLIQSGEVRVCKNFGQPDEVELIKLGKGDFFGEMCILETLPRSATVQAMADSTLYSLTSLAFYHLYQAMPAQYGILILNIARDLSRRLRRLDNQFAARH